MPPKTPSDESPTFEEAMARLDEIVNQMEEEQLPLEDMVSVYEEGVKLLKLCRSRIEGARARVERIQASADGASLTPFDTDEEEPEAKPAKSRRSPGTQDTAKIEDDSGDEIRLF